MAQILIRQVLQQLANRYDRSIEEGVREILRSAVRHADEETTRLGSRIAARFSRVGLTEEIAELRDEPVRAGEFD